MSQSERRFSPFVTVTRPALAFSLSMFASSWAYGEVVENGAVKDVNPGDPLDQYAVVTGSTLNVKGADTRDISADSSTVNISAGSKTWQMAIRNGSTLNVEGATVTAATGSAAGISVLDSQASISNTTVTNAYGTGLELLQGPTTGGGSTVTVSAGSKVYGLDGGVFVSPSGVLRVTGSHIEGTGANSYGAKLFSADASFIDSTVVGGLNGLDIRGNRPSPQIGKVVLDGTRVEGKNGSAIYVDGQSAASAQVNIDVLNGSTLIGGNGTLLEVARAATVNMGVANSALTGNVEVKGNSTANLNFDGASMVGDFNVESGSTGSLALQNGSVFTGSLSNVSGVILNSNSQWNMTASNTVGALAMDNGQVTMGQGNNFYQLNVGSLAGNGTFAMNVDFATNQHDVLNVTGASSGDFNLLVANSGVDPLSPQALTLVHTASGTATFAVLGGQVDVGTYSYQLSSSSNGSGGTDWFLDPNKKTISPGTRSVLALFNTAPTVWYGELTSLRSRMGELRFNGGQAGGWMRAYGNKYNVSDSSGVGYQQNQQGFSLGADAPLPAGDGQWLIGAMVGHSASDLNLKHGTSGTVKSYYVGGYGTWLDADSGYYFDGVVKLNRFENEAKVVMSDGGRAKGNYGNTGVGGSAEFGRHIKLDDGYFIEPFSQLSAVVIQGKRYGLNNGMEADGDRTRSLLGKAGVTTGRSLTLDSGTVVQPYLRAAWVHEFAKNNEVQVNNNVFNNDLSGSRAEFGTGVAVALSKSLQVHADFDYSKGKAIEQPFGANVGLRYSW